MKTHTITLGVALLVGCAPAPAPQQQPTQRLAQGTGTLSASITNVRSTNGSVFCALFQSASGFPGSSPIIGGALRAPATVGTIRCEWTSLPAGDYAVSVFHDENGNESLDSNAFGAPVEGYGATKNALPGAAPPSFDDNKVRVEDGARVTANITLRY